STNAKVNCVLEFNGTGAQTVGGASGIRALGGNAGTTAFLVSNTSTSGVTFAANVNTVNSGNVNATTTINPNALVKFSSGTLTFNGATLSAGGNTINLAGNWNDNGGTFNGSGGTVALTGGNQTISGSTAFNNLTKTVATARTLTFDATGLQTITGTMILQGSSGQLLSLRSSSFGTQWKIDPQSVRTIAFLDVQDSNNIN